ncbi:hypothetical protein CEXT_448141 [Caerostris extrusa]|uniref:Uncharacterized protein n=1 Tax=Caerostris extrusa TaxID=172846 RepID=A0AAV4XTS1_CAEEX|nr:hypothetical protein CEXT_448141 [Caerostris extrusa]
MFLEDNCTRWYLSKTLAREEVEEDELKLYRKKMKNKMSFISPPFHLFPPNQKATFYTSPKKILLCVCSPSIEFLLKTEMNFGVATIHKHLCCCVEPTNV